MNRVTKASNPEHVEIVEIGDGVIASVARYGMAALSNAGAVDLGDITVVFDTHTTPQAAEELRSAATVLGGRVPRLVVNSHDHNDHYLGNQVFAGDAVFAASEQTRQILLDSKDTDLAWAEGGPEHLESLREQVQAAADDSAREDAESRMRFMQALADMHGRLRVIIPEVGLEGRTVLEGSRNSADLIPFERSHAGGDLALHLPFAGVVFTGDIVCVKTHPFIGHADPQALLDALKALERLRPSVIVPGHGPLGTLDDVRAVEGYVHDLTEIARGLIATGDNTAAGIGATDVPEAYRHWRGQAFFAANLRALVTRLGGGPIE